MTKHYCNICKKLVNKSGIIRMFVRFRNYDDMCNDYFLELCAQCKQKEEHRLLEHEAERKDF